MRALATFLLEVQVHVRKGLKQAKDGYVELSLPRFEEGLARVTVDAPPQPKADDSRDSESAGSSRSETDREARKYVRVPAERLDNLMDLAGELVVSRSRLLSRVHHLREVQTEIGRGSRALVETVERFSDEHEFTRIDARAFGANGMALAAGAEGPWTAFSELELDRYEDVQVLSRSLIELTNDFSELYSQLDGGLRALTDDSDAFGGIVGGIQTEITRARMVPLEVLFSRLRLPIRDAAMREDKEARVVTEGGGIHLDKAIADALFQPMVHLVRNAVAHGLESAEARKAAGKSPAGAIELVARQELGQVILEVRDDGAGLDLAKLHAQGVAMGLIDDGTPLDDPGVRDLVFAPGLTTEGSARAVAGRGIGCDFVRRAVERLNGSVRVESERGKGARFILALPITLAITKALLVRQGGLSYALPLYFAERILDLQDHDVVDSAGTKRVRLDGAFLSVTSLSKVLGARAQRATGPIVVLRAGAERVLLQVDAVVGQEEIVVKKLGPILTGHPLFAGVTIRGTGEMVLILDVPGLAESRLGTGRAAKKAIAHDEDFFHRQLTDVAPAPPEPEPQSQRSLDEPLSVLFVDDSLSVRKVAEKALAALGADVTLAVDGVDALAKIRAKRFDLVFTDLEMPRMHGFELIRELRFLDAYRALPIIVVTSRSGQKHQDQARSVGATEYLTKPFTPRSLEATLRRRGRAKHPVIS
jgi:chemosensory pili system protein ChpA (sensor histidine kinase/response regulator)